MRELSETLVRIFIISQCQNGFAGGIQQYIFGYAMSTHRGNHTDILLCLTFTKNEKSNTLKPLNRNVYLVSLHNPSRLHVFINVMFFLMKMRKYKHKIIVYSSPSLFSLALGLFKFNQTLFLLQEPKFFTLGFLFHSILSKLGRVRYIASDEYISALYKPAVKKNISAFFPNLSKVFADLRGKLPPEFNSVEAKLDRATPIIAYIGYIEYPRFSLSHFIAFLKQLKSSMERRNKEPLVILVVRLTKFSNKLVKYLANKLASLQLTNNVIIIDRFISLEEKIALLKNTDACLQFLLTNKHYAKQPTIPPMGIAECVALGKPLILFVEGLDKLKLLGNLYKKQEANKHILIVDISDSNYIYNLQKSIEYIIFQFSERPYIK